MRDALPTPPIEITRTIKEKTFIILSAWFLLIFVYQNILYRFVDELKERRLINFGEAFVSTSQLGWGDQFFPNLLKIVIDVSLGLLGGITVGYLITKTRLIFKFFYSFFSSFLQIFLPVLVIYPIYFLKGNADPDTTFGSALFALVNVFVNLQPVYACFILVSFVSVFCAYFYGIKLGVQFREECLFGTDRESRDTLLDIKWYHWLWFWVPVGIYLRFILWLAYATLSATGTAVIAILKEWKWYNLLGVTDSGQEQNHDVGGILFWGYISIAITLYLLYLDWEILSGRRVIKNKFLSFLAVFGISFVIPLLGMLLLFWWSSRK